MQYFTFNLPVKKHIQKYLTVKYGQVIQARLETEIGFVVLNTLASRLEAQVSRGYLDLWQGRYNSSVTFRMPFHYFYLTKRDVSPFTCTLLNRYFEQKFEEEFCQFVEIATTAGSKRKKAIEQFSFKYQLDIEDDISFDALKQMDYRSRKKNIENSLCSLSPENNLFSKTA